MIKFNYKDVAKEQGWSFDAIDPLVEQSCDYFYYKEVAKAILSSSVMLDIGRGSGEKAVRYFSNAKKVVMIDNEPEMLKKVEENIQRCLTEKEQKKFVVQLGDGDGKLDFEDESFDFVVSRHCGANMSEVFRVLKKGGVFISEDIDFKDCEELKKYFGRGQDWENIINNTPRKKEIFNQCLDLGFSDINLKNFEQIEYYPNKQQLKYLLTRTPILDYFDEEKDDVILDKYIADNQTEKGIKLIRRLYAFYLVK
ncbi:MAG: class I SAM-dependent methyltransferase [Clostridia bacterium]|nr:class I SAM-dependent methyltransferase [Clostridia bacterium]